MKTRFLFNGSSGSFLDPSLSSRRTGTYFLNDDYENNTVIYILNLHVDRAIRKPSAVFNKIPEEPLLTLGLDSKPIHKIFQFEIISFL